MSDPAANPIDSILEWHRIAFDSMRVTTRVIEKEIRDAVTARHVFRLLPPEDALEKLEVAKKQIEDPAIVAMVAAFEQCLRDDLIRYRRKESSGDDPVNKAIHKAIEDDIKFWKFEQRVLEIFRSRFVTEEAASELIGSIKQVIGYRNWVAHGRPTLSPPDGNVVLDLAAKLLTRFLVETGIVSTDPRQPPGQDPAAASD